MSSGSYILNVPKLRGRENYDDWAFAARNFLVLEGIDIDAIPGDLSAIEDRKAKAKLVMTIDPKLYVHIKNETKVEDLWKKLQRLFDDSGFTRRISLLRTLISIRLDNCESMTNYVSQIVETAQRLKGTGFEINEEWIGSLLLAGLPEKFAPMIMAIEHSGIAINSDVIKTKLLDMSSGSEAGSADNEVALWSKPRSTVGHSVKGAQQTKRNTSNTTINRSTVKKVIRCYKCKKTGHYKNQCPEQIEKPVNVFSAAFFNSEFNSEDWYIDSGASAHMTCNKDSLLRIRQVHDTKEIIVANKMTVPVICAGDTRIITKVNNSQFDINVNNILYIPNLTTNLLSVSQLIENGNIVSFKRNVCLIHNQQKVLIGVAKLVNGVYKLGTIKSEKVLAATVQSAEAMIWHRRLGHINSNDLQKMKNGAVGGISYGQKADIQKSNCEVCCEGKQTRLPFALTNHRSEKELELVHSDLCGPMEVRSIGQARYFLLFVDDASRMAFVYFLKEKNQVVSCFKEFQSMVENQKGTKIKTLRTDNGGEFCSEVMEKYLKESGIIHQKTNPYTPEQNGVSERFNRTIVERAKCLLFDAKMEKLFWAEAVNTAVYLKNRTPASGLGQKTPIEIWTGRKPDLSHLRVFGSPVMMHVPKSKRLKWDRKAVKYILVGYPDNTKGYRLYNPETNKICTSRNVVIMERNDDVAQVEIYNTMSDKQHSGQEKNSEEDCEKTFTDQNDPSYICNIETSTSSTEDNSYHTLSEEEDEIPEHVDIPQLLEKRSRKQPDRYGLTNLCVSDEVELCADEITYEEATEGVDKVKWQQAMCDELQAFEENQAWDIVNRDEADRVVQCRYCSINRSNKESSVALCAGAGHAAGRRSAPLGRQLSGDRSRLDPPLTG